MVLKTKAGDTWRYIDKIDEVNVPVTNDGIVRSIEVKRDAKLVGENQFAAFHGIEGTTYLLSDSGGVIDIISIL